MRRPSLSQELDNLPSGRDRPLRVEALEDPDSKYQLRRGVGRLTHLTREIMHADGGGARLVRGRSRPLRVLGTDPRPRGRLHGRCRPTE